MALTCYYQPKFGDILAAKSADFASLNASTMLYCALLAGASMTARATTEGWEFLADATASMAEETGTGYLRKQLTSVTYSTTGLISTLSCASPSWTSATWTDVRAAVFYDNTGATDAAKPLIALWDLGGAQTVTAGTFTLTIAGTGLVTWAAAA